MITETQTETQTEEIAGKVTLYRTSDIYFASFLCAVELPLVTTEIEKSDNRIKKKIIFVFKIPVKDLPRLKSLYFGGRATVNVQRFVQSLRNLKSMCFV